MWSSHGRSLGGSEQGSHGPLGRVEVMGLSVLSSTKASAKRAVFGDFHRTVETAAALPAEAVRSPPARAKIAMQNHNGTDAQGRGSNPLLQSALVEGGGSSGAPHRRLPENRATTALWPLGAAAAQTGTPVTGIALPACDVVPL